MYNGIGLATARGSGTNGHVQRNWALVRPKEKEKTYRTEEDLAALEASTFKQPNKEILDHERKRKIELKCAEFQDILEEQGYSAEAIANKINNYRTMLMSHEGKPEKALDQWGRPSVTETHQVAEAQQEKNAKLREAFGISEYFVDGSSFDPDRQAKEDVARSNAIAEKKLDKEASGRYHLVRTPSPVPQVAPHKDSEKKSKKRKNSCSSEEPTKKKKKSKKRKKERSGKDKDKKKRKKKRKRHVSSSDEESTSSSEDESSADERRRERKKRKKDKKKSSKKKRSRSLSSSRESSPATKRSAKADKLKAKAKATERTKEKRDNNNWKGVPKESRRSRSKERSKRNQNHISHQKYNRSQSNSRSRSPERRRERNASRERERECDKRMKRDKADDLKRSWNKREERSESPSRRRSSRSNERRTSTERHHKVSWTSSRRSVDRDRLQRERNVDRNRYRRDRREHSRSREKPRRDYSDAARRNTSSRGDKQKDNNVRSPGRRTPEQNRNHGEVLQSPELQRARKSRSSPQFAEHTPKRSELLDRKVSSSSLNEHSDVKEQVNQRKSEERARESNHNATPTQVVNIRDVREKITAERKHDELSNVASIKRAEHQRSPSMPQSPERKSTPPISSNKKKVTLSKSLTPEHNKDARRASPAPAANSPEAVLRSKKRSPRAQVPVVRLHASSDEEGSERECDRDVDEEREKELRMLRLLKSGLAAKAKEALEKKIIPVAKPVRILSPVPAQIVTKVVHQPAAKSPSIEKPSEPRDDKDAKEDRKSRSKSLESKRKSKSRSSSRSSFSSRRSRTSSTSSSSTHSSRSKSRSRSRSRSRSTSRSRSSSSSSASSRSRSPSIPRRHGSPSFLDRRRITSARKRPIPYHRQTPTSPSSASSASSSPATPYYHDRQRSASHSLSPSLTKRLLSPDDFH